MKLIKSLATLLIGVSMTSCLGETTNTYTQDFTSYTFNYVTDNQNSTSLASTSATLKLKSDAATGKVSVDITNLQLPSAGYISLSLPDRTVTITEDGGERIYVPAFTSVVNGQSHMVTNFDLKLYGRYIGGQSYNLLVCSYDVDSRYSVRTVYTPAYYWGNTNVIDQDNKTYTNTAQTSFYGFGLDPDTRTGKIAIVNAKFAQNMPAMTMTLPNVPLTLTNSSFLLSADEVTPEIGGVPFPSYKITDLKVSGAYDGPVIITFTCTLDSEKVKGTYRVSASLGIMPSETSQN